MATIAGFAERLHSKSDLEKSPEKDLVHHCYNNNYYYGDIQMRG